MREPERGGLDREVRGARRSRRFSVRRELAELKAVGAALLLDRPILHMVLGVTVGAFAAYGFYYFIPAYFRREFGLGTADRRAHQRPRRAALRWASAFSRAAGCRILSRARARAGMPWCRRSAARSPCRSYALAILANDWQSATVLLSLAGFFWYASLGPTFGVVQNVAGARRRATATAFLYICLSMIALGLGPLVRRLGHRSVRRCELRARRLTAHSAPSCPGGAATAGAGAPLRIGLSVGARAREPAGLLLTVGFFAWAVVHYFLAAAGIGRSLGRRRSPNASRLIASG